MYICKMYRCSYKLSVFGDMLNRKYSYKLKLYIIKLL